MVKDVKIELDRETDGRWIAEVRELPGVMVYGATEEEARERVLALADEEARGSSSPRDLPPLRG